ncbi:MAG: AAA family ATPase, partial [Pseudomonadota bacterium]
MFLQHIEISHFRNIKSATLCLPKNGLCVISGPNGSGKTSLLEAIYTLTYGKSFRTSDPSQLVQNDQNNFTLFASLISDNHQETTIGVQRDRKNGIIAKCMGEPAKFAEIARMLPVRVISPT